MYRTRRLATLARSLRLLRSFAYEQFRPAVFYSGLARDTRSLLDALWQDTTAPGPAGLTGRAVLDLSLIHI